MLPSAVRMTHQEGHENEIDAYSNEDRAKGRNIPWNSGVLARPT